MKQVDKLHAYWSKKERDVMLHNPTQQFAVDAVTKAGFLPYRVRRAIR